MNPIQHKVQHKQHVCSVTVKHKIIEVCVTICPSPQNVNMSVCESGYFSPSGPFLLYSCKSSAFRWSEDSERSQTLTSHSSSEELLCFLSLNQMRSGEMRLKVKCEWTVELFYLSHGASSVSLQSRWWWCLWLCRLTSAILSRNERSRLSSYRVESGSLPSRCSYRTVYTGSDTQTWCWNQPGFCLDLWWWCTADHLTNTERFNSLNTHVNTEDLTLTRHVEFPDGRGEDSRHVVDRRADERFCSEECGWSHDHLVSRCRQCKSIWGPAVYTGRPADGWTPEALRPVDG